MEFNDDSGDSLHRALGCGVLRGRDRRAAPSPQRLLRGPPQGRRGGLLRCAAGGGPGPAQPVTALGKSVSALRDDFNAHADRWRAVLLVSPVCGECVLGAPWTFVEADQQALAAGDLRRGYPTPTILLNGRDLFGPPEPTTPTMSCREYAGGVPSTKDIAARVTTRTR